MGIAASIGNKAIMAEAKTAFLCSRRCPASVVLHSYDWAKAMRDKGACVLSGNHSQIEKDVLHYLLKGDQPIIIALARGLKTRLEPEFQQALAKNRLLIIAPFESSVIRVTQETANKRNEFMAQIAEEIFVAYAQTHGKVERLVLKWLKKGKKVSTFGVEENSKLMDAGAVAV
jgi:predicted Rossmann fold nucleotide-binding protein DprA/Smf involved in DNA uptake